GAFVVRTGLGSLRIGPTGELVDAVRVDVGWPCVFDGSAFRCLQGLAPKGVQLGRLPLMGAQQPAVPVSSGAQGLSFSSLTSGGGELLVTLRWTECSGPPEGPSVC